MYIHVFIKEERHTRKSKCDVINGIHQIIEDHHDVPPHFHGDTNRSNQNVLDCSFQGGEVDSGHISIAHIERLTPIK